MPKPNKQQQQQKKEDKWFRTCTPAKENTRATQETLHLCYLLQAMTEFKDLCQLTYKDQVRAALHRCAKSLPFAPHCALSGSRTARTGDLGTFTTHTRAQLVVVGCILLLHAATKLAGVTQTCPHQERISLFFFFCFCFLFFSVSLVAIRCGGWLLADEQRHNSF